MTSRKSLFVCMEDNLLDFRIVYVHRMSFYRTYTRIKNQIKMFTEGFKTLMKPEWVNMFSVPELQQLISGESADIDLEDLKFVFRLI